MNQYAKVIAEAQRIRMTGANNLHDRKALRKVIRLCYGQIEVRA